MKNSLRSKIFPFLIIYILQISFLFAKSGEEHSQDMLEVLGLYSQNNFFLSEDNQNKLQPLFSKINKYIDDYNGINSDGTTDKFYDRLKEEFPFFTYEQKYTHRQIFHWGFDLDTDLTQEDIPSDDQIPEALQQTFSDKYQYSNGEEAWEVDYNGVPKIVIEWHRFLKFLRAEQERRNDLLIRYTKTSLGLRFNKDSRDIAAILYYTHLLGDHIKHSGASAGEAILEVKKIVKNTNSHIRNLTRSENKDIYKDYLGKIEKIHHYTDSQYAQDILNIMKIYVPQILKIQFEIEFIKKGLRFCPLKELQRAA